MAAAAPPILPSYQRFVNGNPVGSVARRSFRPKEKFLILLVFGTFALVCFGAFFYLPEYSVSSPVNRVYGKVFEHMQKAGPDLLIPAPPLALNPGLLRHDGPARPQGQGADSDPHSAGDKAKLLAKIKEDDELERLKNPKVSPFDLLPPTTTSEHLDASPGTQCQTFVNKSSVRLCKVSARLETNLVLLFLWLGLSRLSVRITFSVQIFRLRSAIICL